jgi:small-conductance mechanosensitive channel
MSPALLLAQGFLEGETTLLQYTIPLPPWAVVVALAAAGALFHFVLRSALHRWARATSTDLDNLLLEVTGKAVPAGVLLAIAWVAAGMLDPGRHGPLQAAAWRILGIGFILLLFWSVATLALRALSRWADRNPQFAPVFPPIRFVFKSVVIVVASVTVLAYVNVDITALATALGIGGLAVALALKDTLENFFAGLHIMADRPLMEGDWVQVHETGDRGVVVKIGWRSTRIRTIDNNFLVVPNIKLASGIITNISARDPRVHVRVQVGVAMDSDPDRVVAILEEEARAAVGAIPGLLAEPAPDASLHPGFGPSSLDFTLRVTVDRYESGLTAQDLLRRRILARLRKERIELPFPTTTVRLEKEG